MQSVLGKGLYDLIGEQNESSLKEILLSNITPNKNQPRKSFDPESLQELADSIKLHGILQPIVVQPLSDEKYQIIAGERRYRACKLAEIKKVPAIIKTPSQQETLELALIENLQREEVAILECALAYETLIKTFGLTQEEVAQKVSKSRSAVANTLRLLKLPLTIQGSLKENKISEGHAKVLLGIEHPEKQLKIHQNILDKKLSVRETEKLAKGSHPQNKNTPSQPLKTKQKDLDPLEESLSNHFGTPVQILREDKYGKLILEFYSEEQLKDLIDKFNIIE